MNPYDYILWAPDWAWGMPLIALNVVIHVFCLATFTARTERLLSRFTDHRNFILTFAVVMGIAVILVTLLHVLEAGIWAIAYRYIGAIADNKSAMLYSLGAITTYGHANIFLDAKWQMLGALEALNGMLLFGLTTAFMFAMIHRVWPVGNR
ncbi:MAG: hypothetical protein WCP68_15570 [Enhydrobacter sp.]